MRSLQPVHAGLAFGALLALWHAAWSALVWIGWAQGLADLVFWLHFIKPVYAVQPFEAGRAATLVAVAFLAGFALAWTMAVIWNWIARPRSITPQAPGDRRARP